MSTLNALLRIVAFREGNTVAPQLNHFKWTREILGVPVENPTSFDYTLGPGEELVVFDSQRAIGSNLTSEFEFSQSLGSGVYKLQWTGVGAAPNFRTTRNIGVDNTTQVNLSVDLNTGIVTLTTPSGTPINTTTVVTGDEIFLSDALVLPNNAGIFKIIAKTPNSVLFRNTSATDQTVTLGTNPQSKLKIFSSSGVKKGDRVVIKNSSYPFLDNVYEIVNVLDDSLFLFSKNALPNVSASTGWELSVFSAGKQFIYLETDKTLSIQVNNVDESDLEVFSGPSNAQPGVYLKKSLVYRLVIRNKSSTDSAKVFFASAE